MATRLPHTFFGRPADVVARNLVGCILCVSTEGGIQRLPITETEAYMGPHDLACHASKGRTTRTDVMFREAGTIYVYLIYGMYEMLNIVTGPHEFPAAVLIRGAGAYDGPGILTRALGITRDLNTQKLGRRTGLWIEQRASRPRKKVVRTPRIGISNAGSWTHKKLRFVAMT